jgi:hypothetical protein
MKRRMLQLLLLVGALLVSCTVRAQDAEVHFTYDACGNRILRSMQLKKIEENGRNVEDKNSFMTSATERFLGTEVCIYPNPTEGRFAVMLSDNVQATIEATLTTYTGVVVEHHRFGDRRHEFDLSSQPAGIYILKLVVATESRTWKIVKQ